jgi:hypothetical protein
MSLGVSPTRSEAGVQQKAERWGILPWGYDDIVWIDDIVDDIVDDNNEYIMIYEDL